MPTPEIIILGGKPYSGKSSLSRKFINSESLGKIRLLTMGERLRSIAAGEIESKHSKVLKENLNTLKQHNPVPKEIPLEIFEEFVNEDPESLIILDGFPRYPDRLTGFEESLIRLNANVIALCRVDVEDAVVFKRIKEREQRYPDIEEDYEFVNKRITDYRTNMIPTMEHLAKVYPLYLLNGEDKFDHNLEKMINIYKTESKNYKKAFKH